MQLSSSANVLGESSGSSRRVALISSRDAFCCVDLDNLHARTTEAIPGAAHRNSSWQRSSQIGTSNPKRVASSTRNGSHVKNYVTAVKSIEGLKIKKDDAH